MTGHSDKNSFRNFPADMFILSGIPIAAVALLASMVPLNIGFLLGGALLMALVGAALIFWAKIPLYRSGIYFSFGPALLQEKRKVVYYWGLSLTSIGCVLALMLIPLR